MEDCTTAASRTWLQCQPPNSRSLASMLTLLLPTATVLVRSFAFNFIFKTTDSYQ